MIVTVSGPVRKMCPYRDEVDEGTARLTFQVGHHNDAPELHGLAESLLSAAESRLSHEEFTREIWTAWFPHGLIGLRTTWQTAGLEVTCALPHGRE